MSRWWWLLLLLLPGCKRLSDAPDLTEGRLLADLLFYNGQRPFVTGDTIRDGTGRLVAVDRFGFIAGGVWVQDDLHRPLASYPGNRWLIDEARNTTFEVGALPVGHMHALVLTLGVPEAQVPQDEDWTSPGGDPVYLVLSGRMDADGDGEVGPAEAPLDIRCGGSPVYYAMAVSHQDVLPGSSGNVGVRVDLGRLLEHIDAMAANGAAPSDSVPLAVVRNLSAAITGTP